MINNTKKRKKILLIDSDDTQLTIAESILENEYEICKAKSENEALKYFYNNEYIPDLILLDILMPKIDGWEVFGRIMTISELKKVPIVFLTSAEGGEEEKKKAHELGAVDYIMRPYNKTDLRKKIKNIIESQ